MPKEPPKDYRDIHPYDWAEYRRQWAGQMMAAIITSRDFHADNTSMHPTMARYAVAAADALIAELQKGGQQ